MARNVLIAGGGKVGSYLATLLLDSGHRVRLVEVSEARIQRLAHTLPGETLILGSAADPDVLERAGIHTTDTLAAVTEADEINLVTTSLARFEFDVPRTIGRVNNPKNAWMYTPAMGVDIALNQADLMAHLIAEEMSLGDMTTLLKLRRGQFDLVEERVHAASVVLGTRVADMALPPRCTLVSIIRGAGLLVPRGDTVLEPGDEVLAVVHRDETADLAALLGPA